MPRMLILAGTKDNEMDRRITFSSTDYTDYAEREKRRRSKVKQDLAPTKTSTA